jgi:uncharacterized protein DUF3570
MFLIAKRPLPEALAQKAAAVAVTKKKKKKKGNATLLALSSMALALPGINAKAAIPVAEPQVNAQFGYYNEEGTRMEAEVYHGDVIVPIKDFLEFTFSYDWDTYVGATPSYSTPKVMADVVAAASGSDSAPYDVSFNLFLHPDAIAARAVTPGTALQKLDAGFDAVIQRAIPDFKPVQYFNTQPRENRDMPVFGTNLYVGDVSIGLSGGTSMEPDFESTFGSINMSWELNNKLTTLSAGYGLTLNDITRTEGSGGGGHHGGGSDENAEDFRAESTFHRINLGLSQILSKNTLFHLDGSYTNQAGYLSNPYKFVYVRGEITAEEYRQVLLNGPNSEIGFSDATNLEVVGTDLFRDTRPDERHQWVIAAGVNQHITQLDASLHFDYRYYMDSWDISSHTFEFAWYQSLPHGITVTPSIRYYSQSAADFFAPYFLAPRADGNYSSDYRLSGFGKVSGGLTLSKQFAKGVKLNAGFEYFTHQGSLKLGGGGTDDYADIDSYLMNASLQVNLSSLGRSTGGGHGHHTSHSHHGGHPPAGVMFGHMLDKPGAMMVGYNYAYSDWSGDMLRGSSQAVSDQEILSNACADSVCTFKPDEMIMHMHMFNFMYAPTDWLNLMVMPQIMDMDMEMLPLPSSDSDEGGSHSSAGLGDTLMVALIKLFNNDSHHLHLGLGFSAPTGSIEATFDNSEAPDSELQSFGMQIGSGTWDFKPSLTYLGNAGRWSWGAQVLATKRMESRNKLGYVLGDELTGTIWGGFRASDWLSFSLRNVYKAQSRIRGEVNRVIPETNPPTAPEPTPLENPSNYGGQFWDIGLGMTLSVPRGEFSGHSLSFEWLQPVIHDFNGYQMERNGVFVARWNFAF